MGLKVVIGRIQLHHHGVIVRPLIVNLEERRRVIVQIHGGLSSAYDREGIDPSRVWLKERSQKEKSRTRMSTSQLEEATTFAGLHE